MGCETVECVCDVRLRGLCAQGGEAMSGVADCVRRTGKRPVHGPVPFTNREGMGVVEELDVVLHAADSVKGL